MFQPHYIIQFSSVLAVFCIWFLSSFILRFRQFSLSKHGEIPNEEISTSNHSHTHYRSAASAERTLLDGLLLLSVGLALNVFGQGHRTAGDVLSLIVSFTLFFMTIFHHIGKTNWTFGLWIVVSLALLAYYIVPFATHSLYLGYYNNAYNNVPAPIVPGPGPVVPPSNVLSSIVT